MRGIAALVVLLLPLAARAADGDEAEARRHFDTAARAFAGGKRAREVGDEARAKETLALAVEEYKQSYELAPYPGTMFALAQAHRARGDLEPALRCYEQYLKTAPDGKYAGSARTLAAGLDEQIKKQHAAQTAPPDGVPSSPDSPNPASAKTTPPPGRAPAPIALTPPPSPPPPVPQLTTYRPWYRSGLGWGLAGSGVGLLAIGGGLLGESAVLAESATTAPSQFQHDNVLSSAGPYKWSGVALVSVGGALVVGGIVVFALNNRRSK